MCSKEVSEPRGCFLTAVRVTSGQEGNVALLLKARIESKNLSIPSLVVVPGLRGFIFVETEHYYIVQNVIQGVKHCKGVVRGKISLNELLLTFRREVQVDVGDVVEIVAGPFRGYKARVLSVDKDKGTVRLEVVDAASPIPITLRLRDVRVIERGGEKGVT